MIWTTPAATDMRFGFEITMYIANRSGPFILYESSFGVLVDCAL